MSSPGANPTPAPRRTFAYIDSWNLYFGCLKGTPYRWINVAEMIRRSMPAHYAIEQIRFFTARTVPRDDPNQAVRQQALFRALQTLPNLTMHFGMFMVKAVRIVRRLGKHVTVLSPSGKAFEMKQAATRFRHIDPAVLAESQFPPELRDAQGRFYKPTSW